MKLNECFWKPYLLLFTRCTFFFLPIFLRKLNIFHCLVCIHYAILTYFFKRILKKSIFAVFQFEGCLLNMKKNILLRVISFHVVNLT